MEEENWKKEEENKQNLSFGKNSMNSFVQGRISTACHYGFNRGEVLNSLKPGYLTRCNVGVTLIP